jgi:hypothetical protein
MTDISYRLDGHKVVPCNVLEWAAWNALHPHREKIVGRTIVGDEAQVEVSTVFIGLFDDIFETAILTDDDRTKIVEKYETWEEAAAGHEKWVEEMRRVTSIGWSRPGETPE